MKKIPTMTVYVCDEGHVNGALWENGCEGCYGLTHPVEVVPLSVVAEEIMDAQAELQMPLGIYRLDHGRGGTIERRLTLTLARLHRLLSALGTPMLHPTTHADLEWIECDHEEWTEVGGLLGDRVNAGAVCVECGLVGPSRGTD